MLTFEDDLHLVIHLMVAGRFQWRAPGKTLGGRNTLASFHFTDGVLFLTEASKKKRAALHLVEGAANLTRFDRGGLDVFGSTLDEFAEALTRENHTLKRALTDPRLFSGIGNAYSDEILHRAKLSPLQLTSKLSADGDRPAARGDEGDADGVDRPAARRGWRSVSVEGHRLPA